MALPINRGMAEKLVSCFVNYNLEIFFGIHKPELVSWKLATVFAITLILSYKYTNNSLSSCIFSVIQTISTLNSK